MTVTVTMEKPESIIDSSSANWPPKADLFGLGVSVTTYDEAVDAIIQAAKRGEAGVVSCHAVHAIVTFTSDRQLRSMANTFEMITPDGQPVRWGLNLLYRAGLTDRVYGPETMMRTCNRAAQEGISIYLYGGNPEVADRLQANLRNACPGLEIAGYEAPPFRQLTPEEDQAVVERINKSGAAIVFIGLGCPKQDVFAYEHRESIHAIQICIGAAFDFHAGVKKQAPEWMQKRGLEWLYRLIQEPRRLWKRYLVTNTVFVTKLAWQFLRRGRRSMNSPES